MDLKQAEIPRAFKRCGKLTLQFIIAEIMPGSEREAGLIQAAEPVFKVQPGYVQRVSRQVAVIVAVKVSQVRFHRFVRISKVLQDIRLHIQLPFFIQPLIIGRRFAEQALACGGAALRVRACGNLPQQIDKEKVHARKH